ncbi:MAG: helix-turn-helix domain-containing protein [Planctomycetaceae bacterium]|jgi:excisionase family DNA binding protein|nr:helix-turn-helix domain-containing protein [Planctomycetaceae bacterium]
MPENFNETACGLLTVKEAAKWLKVSERTLWKITSPRASLKCCRIGNRVLYSLSALQNYVAEKESGTLDA